MRKNILLLVSILLITGCGNVKHTINNTNETKEKQQIIETQEELIIEEIIEDTIIEQNTIINYNANRMTHYVMDGTDAGTCIAGRWCIGNQLIIASDSSVRYYENGTPYYVWAVHCSVVHEWRGSIIRIYYTDGGIEDGIVLDCGSFYGYTDRMDKAMGTRYSNNQDNYIYSRYIETAEVLRKGW